MKRFISVFFAVLFSISFLYTGDFEADESVSVSAEGYALFCADDSRVLLSKGLNTKMGMASTTKIMTTLLAIEYAQKNDKIVEFTKEMQAEGSSMYLKVGDKVHLSDLAAGMMTVSGNDAANAAAVAIGGSIEKFASMMNKRAEAIGMKNTNFVNPGGLPHENHYSTVYDMALLMAEAMKNEDFRNLTKQKSASVNFVYPDNQRVTYSNHNRLLSMYEYCIGGKTGYTQSTGRCLVTVSEKDNLRLIAVTFNDRNDWQDHIALYEYGFENFSAVTAGNLGEEYSIEVTGSEQSKVLAGVRETKKVVIPKSSLEDVKIRVYLPPFVFAPVKEGQTVGRIICTQNEEVILENDIIARTSADYLEISGFIRFIRSLFR